MLHLKSEKLSLIYSLVISPMGPNISVSTLPGWLLLTRMPLFFLSWISAHCFWNSPLLPTMKPDLASCTDPALRQPALAIPLLAPGLCQWMAPALGLRPSHPPCPAATSSQSALAGSQARTAQAVSSPWHLLNTILYPLSGISIHYSADLDFCLKV